MRRITNRIKLRYSQKLFILAALPLILAVSAIALLVAHQSRMLAEREIRSLETQLIEAKKAELKNYVTQARNGFYFIYGSAAPDDEEAKQQVMQILSAMIYGDEGSFFVYDYDGTNLVSPRQTDMINRDWSGLTDSEGTPVTDALIRIARQGAGYHEYLWPKPSTGEEARMISYVTSFPSWQWAVGTGVFIDDVIDTVAAARAEVERRVEATFVYIGGITLLALLAVFASGMLLNLRERRLADMRLRELTQRVLDTQEEERGRVARELHDGISQILVGVKYALDIARRRVEAGDPRAAETLHQGVSHLSGAIQEVRRISRDLRPGVLDDLGLGPALKALCEDFTARTGIQVDFETVVFRNRLDQEAKIALYRIAQEALTNVERHSGATRVAMDLRGHLKGGTLRITDNGCGLGDDFAPAAQQGIGLRNMQERMEHLGGSLRIHSTRAGTEIEAQVPLSHLLPPEETQGAAPHGTAESSPSAPNTDTRRGPAAAPNRSPA
ncbi:Oxygen sensor histidine kinase NreB [Roseivivax sp. THAF40]|uniref:cache domain-containing protein n=1 Tax=unclassified Roseivivax TaxID=2639302 RepID=UPI0012681E2D|nr:MULTISPECIES: cache domain-containing protein [unclassified Roseivivax]QFS83108.1 Oxygen sensor histidine kinase NreB [Roseivivax sp. THAF197b]QFT46852.1 Oxygen sensor histidine kinase NreB [Roseivivax sp. THAF40]